MADLDQLVGKRDTSCCGVLHVGVGDWVLERRVSDREGEADRFARGCREKSASEVCVLAVSGGRSWSLMESGHSSYRTYKNIR